MAIVLRQGGLRGGFLGHFPKICWDPYFGNGHKNWKTSNPQSDIVLKKFSCHTKPNALKLIWGLLKHYLIKTVLDHCSWLEERAINGLTRFWNWTQNRLFLMSQSTWNEIWCEASGQQSLNGLCSPSRSALSKEALGRQTSKSVIFLKNPVRNYRSKCAEFDMGSSEACMDIQVCSTWLLAHGKGARYLVVLDTAISLWKGRSSGVFHFGNEQETFSPRLPVWRGANLL